MPTAEADPAPPQGARELDGHNGNRSKVAFIVVLAKVSDGNRGYDPKRASLESWRAAGLWGGDIASDGGC